VPLRHPCTSCDWLGGLINVADRRVGCAHGVRTLHARYNLRDLVQWRVEDVGDVQLQNQDTSARNQRQWQQVMRVRAGSWRCALRRMPCQSGRDGNTLEPEQQPTKPSSI